MTRKSMALDWVAIEVARRYLGEYAETRSEVNGNFAGFGGTEDKALTDAIARGNLSPISLDDLKHGCQARIYDTPFGVVILREG